MVVFRDKIVKTIRFERRGFGIEFVFLKSNKA